MRPSRLGLLLVLAVAAALRFWALGHGIPYALSVDEPEIVERALRMMKTGTLNPHFFDYGQLLIYIQFLVSVVRFIAGSVTGAWDSLAQVTSDSFYLWGRAVDGRVRRRDGAAWCSASACAGARATRCWPRR